MYSVDDLKNLFHGLSKEEKKEFLRFVYATEEIQLIREGLFAGPAPSSKGYCNACGRPF